MIKQEKLTKNRSNDQQWPWSNVISIVILTTGGGGGGGGGGTVGHVIFNCRHCTGWLAAPTGDWRVIKTMSKTLRAITRRLNLGIIMEMRINQIYLRSMMTWWRDSTDYETEILVLILELSRTLSRLPCVPTAPLTVHTPARAGLSRALI